MARRLVPARRFSFLAASLVARLCWVAPAQVAQSVERQKVILDTDIGDDIDDVFAVALALSSPDLELLGITTAWGDTQLRARLVDRLLCETGTQNIPVLAGIPTESRAPLNQRRWAERFPKTESPY